MQTHKAPVENPDATADPAVSDGSAITDEEATNAFSTSMLVSGIRCTLAYVVFPWLLPLVGVANGVGPAIGIAISVIAIGFNIASIRRFQVSRHRWRTPITILNCGVIVLLAILAFQDLRDLL